MGNNVAIIKRTSYIEDGKAFGRERKELFLSTEVLMEKLTLSRLNIVRVSALTIGISVFLSNIIHGFKLNIFCFILYHRK